MAEGSATDTNNVNPAVPHSVGALLAEEWTIDPYSTLPSFLELKMMEEAAKSIVQSLRSGLQYVERSIQPRQHRMWAYCLLKVLRKWGPEIRLLMLYLVQRYCIQSRGATISESLYGMKRVQLAPRKDSDRVSGLSPLSARNQTRLALWMALAPYIRERSETSYKNWKRRQQQQQTIVEPQRLPKLRQYFFFLYPYIRTCYEGLDLLYQWRYLLGKSIFFHPASQWLLGEQVIRRLTQEDQNKSIKVSTTSSEASTAASTSASSEYLGLKESDLRRKITSILSMMLSSAVAVQWLAHVRTEWQQSDSSDESPGVTGLLPPPPSMPACYNHRIRNNQTCPLCRRQPRVHPTAATSGFVFCLGCLLPYVKEHGKCPITGMDCPPNRVVRLYEPDEHRPTAASAETEASNSDT